MANRSRWGGARAGAGRPKRGPIASERHTTRPLLRSELPVHVIARIERALHALPRRAAYAAVRHALRVSLARTTFRIVRLAIHANRLELLVEADDKHALARGMQGFQVSAARALNRAAARTGGVFADRYRMAILRTRSAVRAAVRATAPTVTAPADLAAPVTAPASPATSLLRGVLARPPPP